MTREVDIKPKQKYIPSLKIMEIFLCYKNIAFKLNSNPNIYYIKIFQQFKLNGEIVSYIYQKNLLVKKNCLEDNI